MPLLLPSPQESSCPPTEPCSTPAAFEFDPCCRFHGDFREDVLRGLLMAPRSLPSKYLYDDRGSKLFDQICELPEYYPTRTETAIMKHSGDEMAERLGRDVRLVELGSGSSVKTRILLDRLVDPSSYLPVDISGPHLRKVASELAQEYPLIDITPKVADFTQPFDLPEGGRGGSRTCVYFPGSTIGNLLPDQASRFLRMVADLCAEGGGLLIGVDLQKSASVLEAAYNDGAGITAAFNKNLLRRVNRELRADFDLDRFRHVAIYNADAGRIEMHLESLGRQEVTVGEHTFAFADASTILTEYSHKYTLEGFSRMARSAGWSLQQSWTDPRDYFAVLYLETI